MLIENTTAEQARDLRLANWLRTVRVQTLSISLVGRVTTDEKKREKCKWCDCGSSDAEKQYQWFCLCNGCVPVTSCSEWPTEKIDIRHTQNTFNEVMERVAIAVLPPLRPDKIPSQDLRFSSITNTCSYFFRSKRKTWGTAWCCIFDYLDTNAAAFANKASYPSKRNVISVKSNCFIGTLRPLFGSSLHSDCGKMFSHQGGHSPKV